MEKYRAVCIKNPGDLNTMNVDLLDFPELKQGELLVQMEYSTINPSDVSTAHGRYPTGQQPPYVIGLEGSGTVVKSGGGQEADSLVSKRVAVRGRGTWGEYTVASFDSVFPLLDSTTFEQAANLIVNPITVALFMDKIKTNSHKAAVQNAAASALGKMFIKWCKASGIPLVNLVRRQEQVDLLKAIGAEHVFNTSENDWKNKAKQVCDELGVSAGFDAIAGSSTSDIAELLANGGAVYNYGRLSKQDAQMTAAALIFQRKSLEGLWLTRWISGKTCQERYEVGYLVQGLISDVLKTEHSRIISLEEVKDVVANYEESSSTNNKILIKIRNN